MTKRCPTCSKQKDVSEFSWRIKARNRRQSSCKICVKEYNNHSYRHGNRAHQVRERAYRHRKELRLKVDAYKMKLGCSRCGYAEHPAALDMHHHEQDSKEAAVVTMIHDCVSEDRLWKEIAKCTVLCANCHRIVHVSPHRTLVSSLGFHPRKGGS